MTESKEYFTWSEIHEQPRALELVAKNLSAATWADLRAPEYQSIVFTGCGSSYYLSLIAAHTFSTMLGKRAFAVPASELLFYPEAYLHGDSETLIFITSRTGETTEATRLAETLQSRQNTTTVTLTCYEKSKLARLGDFPIVVTVGKEESVVMTKAFSCLLLTLTYLAYQSSGRRPPESFALIPSIIAESLNKNGHLIQAIAEDQSLKNFVFLGSGLLYGLACESALKIKEMAAVPATAYHTLEFRHGPKAALNEDALVVLFPSEKEKPHLRSVIDDIRSANAKIFMIGNGMPESVLKYSDHQISFHHKLDAYFDPIIYAHLAQLLAYWKAVTLGLNPDKPRHLSKVVLLEG